MNDAELRALVRDAVARHFAGPSAGRPDAPRPAAPAPSATGAAVVAPHASHDMYITLVNVGDACVIEPGVSCDHCGYCKSHGH